MKKLCLLVFLLTAACNTSKDKLPSQKQENTTPTLPNILLITLDDMNWNAPASFGGAIPDLTPNIDALATSGLQFNNAYVQVANCSPSRAVIQTGLYPHQSGIRGFYFVENQIKTLSGLLKEKGYYTGVLNKKADTSIHPNYDLFWNEHSSFPGNEKRSAAVYGVAFNEFLSKVQKENKPYYCVLNIADPHKPFFNDAQSKKQGFDNFKPSKIYTLNDVSVPEFLPNTPAIKQQILNYYNSVKRGDDCVGAVLKVLKNSSNLDNTIVILLSDHGMAFPYAKSTVYQNGLKTPMLVSWPKKISPKVVNNLISAIDIAPTLLDLLGMDTPKEMMGTSFFNLIKNEPLTNENDFVFGQFDENAGGVPRPSRSVTSKRFGYIFNPWATGNIKFVSDASHQETFKDMQKKALENPSIKKRFDFWLYRSIEEFYDYEKDPNALNNLIDNPLYINEIEKHRQALKQQMAATNDYVLSAFENKENLSFLDNWMKKEISDAEWRCKNITWKRDQNHMGSTKNNTQLYKVSK